MGKHGKQAVKFSILAIALISVLTREAQAEPGQAPPPPRIEAGSIFLGPKDGKEGKDKKHELAWPLSKLYGISESLFGRERSDSFLRKGMDSLRKTAYWKYIIGKGYFLLPPYDPADPQPRLHDPTLYLPSDPKRDPRVILMRDLIRTGSSAAGVTKAVREAQASGDKDLVNLAGKSIFDSNLTRRRWDQDWAEKKFGDKPYYYKLRQRGGNRLNLEGGLGGALQIANSPYFVGGSVGGELDGKYSFRRNEFLPDAVPKVKVGAWGKVPFLTGTSFGLSALQAYHTRRGGIFETELRAGLFHGSGNSALGAIAYQRISGEEIFSDKGRTTGAKLYYSPSEAVAYFLSYERREVDSLKSDPEEKYLAGVEFLAGREWLRMDQMAEEFLGERGSEGLKDLYSGARTALSYLSSPQGAKDTNPQGLINALRAKAMEDDPPLALELSAGNKIELPAGALIETARSMERWSRKNPSGQEAPIPGWALVEVPPMKGEDAVRSLAKGLPAGHPTGAAEEILLISASAERRNADYRATQTLMFLTAALKAVTQDAAVKRTSDSTEGKDLLAALNSLDTNQRRQFEKRLAKASVWVGQEYELEGRKLAERLKAYGKNWLKAAMGSSDWPSGLSVEVAPEIWPGLLAGYGEPFLYKLLEPLRESAKGRLSVRLDSSPLPDTPRVIRRSGSEISIQLPFPPEGKSPEEILGEVLAKIARIHGAAADAKKR